MLGYFIHIILSLKFAQYLRWIFWNLKTYFEELLREENREREISIDRTLFFCWRSHRYTTRVARSGGAERLKSVKRNETHTGGRTGSNRVSLVFEHPPWARSSSVAFAKGEKRSNRYSVFVLSDVKRIGRDKTSSGEGWNEVFHPVPRCVAISPPSMFSSFSSTTHCPSRYP